ncbi:MAG TPA: ABC transporter permease [Thermoanaerobaculia bacterium]|nr:ABC transporter permease [Thermoanaerobaculia bacterium]
MSAIHRALAAVRGLFQRRRLEAELDEELRFHLAMETAAQLRQGASPEEAARRAALKLGGLEPTKEAARSARGYRGLEALGQDVRFALRLLRRNPGYAGAVVAALALGIGANTAIFSVVRGVLLHELPYREPDRLVVLHQRQPLDPDQEQGFSVPDIEDLRRRQHTFAGLAEYHSMWFNLLGRGEPERVQTGVVSANFFNVLGTRALLGRTFSPDDDKPGAQPVLVFSHAYWLRSWGGDPAVVGKILEMNDHPHRVIGVLPPVPQYPNDNDLWMPTSACPFRSDPQAIASRRARGYAVFGRLRPGATVSRARQDLATVNHALLAEYPGDYPTGGYRIEAVPMLTELTARARPTLLLLLATVLLVLLIVCANVANLQLARLSSRGDEIGLRTALGAGRGRLLRQLLTESVILALLGAALGIGVAATLLRALVAFAARFTSRTGDIALDGQVLVFTLAVAIVAGLLSGTLPALAASRGIAGAISAGGRGGSGGAGQAGSGRLRAILAGVQVAVSFMLLVGAGLTLRSVWKLQAVDAGFNPENVLAVAVDLDWAHYKTLPLRRTFQRALLEKARALPGTAAAAYSSNYPLDGLGRATSGVRVQGRAVADADLPQADFRFASPGAFAALGIRIERGRGIEETDRDGGPPVAVLGHGLASRLFGSEDPVGRRVTFGPGTPLWHTVVGVIADVRDLSLDRDPGGAVWLALDQNPALAGSLLLRSRRDPLDLAAAARRLVLDIDPRQPVGRVQTLETARAASLAAPRLTTLLLCAFAALALVVTVIGLGGVVAFGVVQRTREIGIRMALGADRGAILAAVLREGLAAVGTGLLVGAAAALLLAHVIARLLFGVPPTDPVTYLAVALLLVAVAALACLLPARRATAVQPSLALRSL